MTFDHERLYLRQPETGSDRYLPHQTPITHPFMMDEVMEKIRTFTRKYTIGRTNGRELSVDLGEICHYMTDFFTYPHNDDIYEHNLARTLCL